MSKSSPVAASKILLTDTSSEIRSKIKSAVTDSISGATYDPETRPGVSNLLEILAGYSGSTVEDLVASGRFEGERGIRDLKEETAEAVDGSLKSFRQEFERIRKESGYLMEREKEGARRAREVAQGVMIEVRRSVGTE